MAQLTTLQEKIKAKLIDLLIKNDALTRKEILNMGGYTEKQEASIRRVMKHLVDEGIMRTEVNLYDPRGYRYILNNALHVDVQRMMTMKRGLLDEA